MADSRWRKNCYLLSDSFQTSDLDIFKVVDNANFDIYEITEYEILVEIKYVGS